MKILHLSRFVATAAGIASMVVLTASNPGAAAVADNAAAVRGMVVRALENRPIQFIANRGQADPRVRYYAVGGGKAVLLGEDGIVIRLAAPAEKRTAGSPSRLPQRRGQAPGPRWSRGQYRDYLVLTPVGGRGGYDFVAGKPLSAGSTTSPASGTPVTGLTPFVRWLPGRSGRGST